MTASSPTLVSEEHPLFGLLLTYSSPADAVDQPCTLTGNTKDKIISELDKIQQEVMEHSEESRERLDRMDRDVQRFENLLLMEVGDCQRSGDSLEKRLSKMEGICVKLDGVSNSISKIKEGTVPSYPQWVQLRSTLLDPPENSGTVSQILTNDCTVHKIVDRKRCFQWTPR